MPGPAPGGTACDPAYPMTPPPVMPMRTRTNGGRTSCHQDSSPRDFDGPRHRSLTRRRHHHLLPQRPPSNTGYDRHLLMPPQQRGRHGGDSRTWVKIGPLPQVSAAGVRPAATPRLAAAVVPQPGALRAARTRVSAPARSAQVPCALKTRVTSATPLPGSRAR